jgi:hypothetical protein
MTLSMNGEIIMRSAKEPGLRRIDETLLAKNGESRGICLVCKNLSTCTYAKAPQWPVVQCEQFIPYKVIAEKTTGDHTSPMTDAVTTFSPARFREMQRIV